MVDSPANKNPILGTRYQVTSLGLYNPYCRLVVRFVPYAELVVFLSVRLLLCGVVWKSLTD